MQDMFNRNYFEKVDGDVQLFREIEIDGPMLVIRSGEVGCKKSAIKEETRLISSEAEQVRTWSAEVNAWKAEGYMATDKKKSRGKKIRVEDPGDTIADVISAIEKRLGTTENPSFTPATESELNNTFSTMGYQPSSSLRTLYLWKGGCEGFLPANEDWDVLANDYAGSDWLTLDESLTERRNLLDIGSKKYAENPLGFKGSWFLLFGGDGRYLAIDLEGSPENPKLIEVDHELGARQTNLSLLDALKRVYQAIARNAWLPRD